MRCPILSQLPSPPPDKTGWPWTDEGLQLPDIMPDGAPWPRVSIVTPSYNQGHFIEETIRSVLLQGYPNLEYIIIDGGSTDGSADIIRKYEKWLAYWVSKPDKGQSDAINKGWRMATGEIVAYLNSDDTYYPGAIPTAEQFFSRYPEVGMVYGDSNAVDDKGALVKRYKLHEMRLDEVFSWDPHIPQPTVFLRREVIDTVGLMNIDLHYAMDYELWMRVELRFKLKYIPKFLATERRHSTAKSIASALDSVSEAIQVVEQFFSQDLPSEISVLRRKSLAANYLRKAGVLLRMGEMSQTRAWAVKVLQLHPSIYLVFMAMLVFFISFLGHGLAFWLLKAKQRWNLIFDKLWSFPVQRR